MEGSGAPRWGWVEFLSRMFLASYVLLPLQMVMSMNPSSAVALGPQISSLNLLLLPLTTRAVRYRLYGSNGCFIWTQDHEDLISLEPEVNQTTPECSTAVIITSIALYSVRRSTTVQATDTITGQVLRCEVFIDKISEIRIFHHSRKLDLHGLSTLSVQAFDAEGNVFSSLVGLQFLWTLEPSSFAGGTSHRLVHVRLNEAALSDTYGDVHGDGNVRVKLEESVGPTHQAPKGAAADLGSDLYVVKGVSVGQEKVTVQLNEPQFGGLMDSVVLTVAEAISLSPPSPVYIAPGMKLQYTLKLMHRNNASVVKLPNKNYEWSVSNNSVANIDSRLGVVVGLNLGRTEVKVTDLRVEGHVQLSMLYIVMPVQLKLYLSPLPARLTMSGIVDPALVPSDGIWHLVAGREYIVRVLAFSKESGTKPILITKDSDLQLFYNSEGIWDTQPIPEDLAALRGWWNGTQLHALKEGTGKIGATLGCGMMQLDKATGEWRLVPKPHLEVEQLVRVCDPVKIVIDDVRDPKGAPDRVLRLPWVPKQPQQYLLTAAGGCGPGYRWTSSNPAIVSASVSGVLRAIGIGKAVVKAAALNNPLNVDEVEVEVSYPATLIPVPGLPVETEVGSNLPVAVMARDSSGSAYSGCDALSAIVDWKVSSSGTVFVIADRTDNTSLISAPGSVPAGRSGSSPKAQNYDATLAAIPRGACASAVLWGLRPGRAKVLALLDVSNVDGEGWAQPPKLEASWVVAAYMPLAIMQARDGRGHGGYGLSEEENHNVQGDYVAAPQAGGHGALPIAGKETRKAGGIRELLLVIGCSLRIELKGGPERWRPGFDFVEDSEFVPIEELHSDVREGLGKGSGPEAGSVTDGLSVEHLPEGLGRTFLIECGSIGTYRVTFYRGNILHSDQPRSSVANATLVVMCKVPASVVLLIDDRWNHPTAIAESAQLERSPDRLHTATHMLVSGRKVRVAAVALDAASKPFANASSLQLIWQLMECEVAEWVDPREGEVKRKSVIQGPWERWLALKDKAGHCVVRATIGDLVRPRRTSLTTLKEAGRQLKASQSLLTDAARLQLVTALRLEPQFLLLFWHPASKGTFKVIGGTSDIQASTNNSWVGEVVHVPMTAVGVSNTLQVSAKNKGVMEVVVRDVGLVHPGVAMAIVMVGDVVWVRLMVPEDASLQLGSNMTITVQAGDVSGHVFDPAQFKLMKLEVHLQDEILTLIGVGEGPRPGAGSYPANTFRVMGANVGVTSGLRVSVHLHSGEKVYSEFARMTVYAPLVINPPWMVLAPGAQFMVLVSGGPRVGVVIQFESSNKTVATVHSSQGNVLALREGNMTLYATATGYGGQRMSEAAIPIMVRIPTSMNLNVRSGRIGVGKEMSVFPVGSVEGEGLISFGQLCADYRWSVENEDVVGLHSVAVPGPGSDLYEPRRQASGVCLEGGDDGSDACRGSGVDSGLRIDIGFSAHLSGRSPGRSTVSVTFTCRFHGVSGSREYTAWNTLWVVPDPPVSRGLSCTWLLPLHYTSSPLLPSWGEDSPSSSSVDLMGRSANSKRTSLYSVMQSGGSNEKVITVDGGKIKTGSRPGVACILETEHSTGRVEVATCVRTAEVAQIAVKHKESPYHAVDLSIGVSQSFAVTLHDEIGTPFYEAQQRSLHLVVESNQPHVASAALVEEEVRDAVPANTSLVIQALHQGTAIIRVRLADRPEISDYVAVQVGAFVSPRNPTLHVGGRINFTIGGRAAGIASGERGKWVSGNEKIVKINPHTGKAEALGKGTTRVFFTGPRITVDTTVSVVQVASLSIRRPEGSGPITNVGDRVYLFPVSFSYKSGLNDGSPKDQSIAFTCELDPPYIGMVSSRRDPESGQSSCVLHPYSPSDLQLDVKGQPRSWQQYDLAGASSGIIPLTVTAVVEGPSGSLVKDRVTLNFVGGFMLAKEAPSQVTLFPRTNRSMVVLVGNVASVDVSWSRKDALSVRDISRLDEAPGLTGKARFEVKVLQQGSPFADVLVFTSRDTGQQLELPVTFRPDDMKPESEISIVSSIVTTVAVAAVVMLLVWVCAWSMDQPQVIPPPPPGSMLSPPGRSASPATPPSGASTFGRTTPVRDMGQQSFDPQLRSPSPSRPAVQSPPYTEHLSRTIQRTPYFDRDMARRFDPTRTY